MSIKQSTLKDWMYTTIYVYTMHFKICIRWKKVMSNIEKCYM